MVINMNAIEKLIKELNDFQSDNKLPHICANEQALENYVNDWQRNYLIDFCNRWDKVNN